MLIMRDDMLPNGRAIRRAIICVLVSGCASGRRAPAAAQAGVPNAEHTVVSSMLADLRTATARFHDLDSAVAAGYPRTVPECLVHAQHGAMGYHHVNRAFLTPTPNVKQPQILLYERLPNGEYRLNGVEFIVPYRLYPRDSVAPMLFGQHLKHEDNLKIWYLHVWAWTNNADGLFADFNPDVRCPVDARVYAPYAAP